jgi:hypothetical protein
MTHVEYLVTIPPEEVMARLSWVIETSLAGTLGWRGTQKKFLGSVKGREFNFRVRRGGHNSFAPVCSGQVVPAEGGSKIVINLRTSYGCLYVFGSFFMLFCLGLTFLVLWITRDPEVAAKFAKDGIPSCAPALLPVGLGVFLIIGFVILRVTSAGDERRMLAIFPSLFSDVLLKAPNSTA